MHRRVWSVILGSICALLAGACGCPGEMDSEIDGAVVRRSDLEITFPALVAASGFERRIGGMPGYHLIVWQDGPSASSALFRALVSDVEVLDAFEDLGATPGDALGFDAWEERNDPNSPAPDAVIQGPKVEISIEVAGRPEPLSLADILEDPGGRGFDMRFGGHRANIAASKSGCVVCLYSCPGSKVGNARYTVRNFVDGATRFRVRPDVLPEDGTLVQIVMKLDVPAAGTGRSG